MMACTHLRFMYSDSMSIKSGYSKAVNLHSQLDSDLHLEHQIQQQIKQQKSARKANRAVGDAPPFIEKGALHAPDIGDMGFDGMSFVSSNTMRKTIDDLADKMANAGTRTMRNKEKMKCGACVTVKSNARRFDMLKKETIHFNPIHSLIYKKVPTKLKKQILALFCKKLKTLMEKKYPNADVAGMQIHDDSGNLHVDVWLNRCKEITIEKYPSYKKHVGKYLYNASSTLDSNAGIGGIVIDRKRRAGHKLCASDQYTIDDINAKRPNTKDLQMHMELDNYMDNLFTAPTLKNMLNESIDEYKKYLADDDKLNFSDIDKNILLKEKVTNLTNEIITLNEEKQKTGDEIQLLELETINLKAGISSLDDEYNMAKTTMETYQENLTVLSKDPFEAADLARFFQRNRGAARDLSKNEKLMRNLVSNLTQFNSDPIVDKFVKGLEKVLSNKNMDKT